MVSNSFLAIFRSSDQRLLRYKVQHKHIEYSRETDNTHQTADCNPARDTPCAISTFSLNADLSNPPIRLSATQYAQECITLASTQFTGLQPVNPSTMHEVGWRGVRERARESESDETMTFDLVRLDVPVPFPAMAPHGYRFKVPR